MAVSRIAYLRTLLQHHARICTVGARFLSSETTPSSASPDDLPQAAPLSAVLDSEPESSTAPGQSGVDDSGGLKGFKGKARAGSVLKREYEEQLSVLRKKYAAEQERKRKEEMQVQKVVRERILVEKEQRLVIRRQRSQSRALEVEEEAKALRIMLEQERVARARRRQWREKRLARVRSKEKEAVRQQSSMWIEEKDLERRIVDALVDPFYLSGSWSAPDRGMIGGGGGDDDDNDDE